MRRTIHILLLLVAVLVLGPACGNDDDSSSGGSRSAVTPAEPGATQAAAAPAPTQPPKPANPDIIVSTTTSTVDSGLLEVLQPLFEKNTGYRLTILSQGSGAALQTGQRGEADVVLAHSPDAEQAFMAGGHGTRRELVMHNDFIVVGPPRDPANIKSAGGINDVMARIAASNTPFISRGDNSGTHALELKLWSNASIQPKGQSWYQESGAGMGQTLQIASEKAGYTLTDRATYLNLRKNLSLDILRQNDAALLNVYHLIQVNPEKSAKVNAAGATAFIEFLLAPDTQRLIGEYGKDKFGEPLFVPDAGKDVNKLGG